MQQLKTDRVYIQKLLIQFCSFFFFFLHVFLLFICRRFDVMYRIKCLSLLELLKRALFIHDKTRHCFCHCNYHEVSTDTLWVLLAPAVVVGRLLCSSCFKFSVLPGISNSSLYLICFGQVILIPLFVMLCILPREFRKFNHQFEFNKKHVFF